MASLRRGCRLMAHAHAWRSPMRQLLRSLFILCTRPGAGDGDEGRARGLAALGVNAGAVRDATQALNSIALTCAGLVQANAAAVADLVGLFLVFTSLTLSSCSFLCPVLAFADQRLTRQAWASPFVALSRRQLYSLPQSSPHRSRAMGPAAATAAFRWSTSGTRGTKRHFTTRRASTTTSATSAMLLLVRCSAKTAPCRPTLLT